MLRDTLPPAAAAVDVLRGVTPADKMLPAPPETVNVILPLFAVEIVLLGNVRLPPEEFVKLKLPPILLGVKATLVAVKLVILTAPVLPAEVDTVVAVELSVKMPLVAPTPPADATLNEIDGALT